MTAWREALGMNKEFAGDEFLPAAPEGLPEGVWDAEAVEVLGRKAWELGVPKEAFAGIVHEFATRSAEAQRAADAAEAERVAAVKAELEGEPAKGLNMPGGAAAGGKAEAERMMNDPSHPLHEAFMNPNHANHRYADEQYNRLMGF